MPLQTGLEHIVREDEPLASCTWLRIGGSAQYFAEPTNRDELAELIRRCREEDLPVRLLGGGSNLLVRDDGVKGLVIHLGAAEFGQVSTEGTSLTAGGGAKLAHVISAAVREGLAGLEPLAGIPGTLGGALHGNSSAHGSDIGQCVQAATVLTHAGELLVRSQEDLVFAYRDSSLDELVILDATFELETADPLELTKRMQKLWIVNKASQPLQEQYAAMLFKDPGGITASSLIEQAGLKGARINDIELSDRDANFMITQPGASSRDALALIEHLRERVDERLGIELEIALEIW